MKRNFAYFSAFALAVVLAAVLQLSFATAQRNPNSGHPSPECEACLDVCRAAFEQCKQERGIERNNFAICARQQQQCAADCRGPGGACNPQTPTRTRR